MRVHFLNSDSLEALRTNLKGNSKHYSDCTNAWIYDYFENENPFIEYKCDFPQFELVYDELGDNGSADVQNIISLYSSMKTLTDTQATDERLWAGMCHSDYWEFLHKRWGMDKISNPDKAELKTINARYFFAYAKKRSLITNSLAKLWWIGRLTYDDNRADSFELTRYLSSDFATKTLVIFSNNYTNNKNITIGLLSALKQLDESGFALKGRPKRDIYYEATKYLNVLGGTYILDCFTSDEITEKVIKYLESISKSNSF